MKTSSTTNPMSMNVDTIHIWVAMTSTVSRGRARAAAKQRKTKLVLDNQVNQCYNIDTTKKGEK